MSGFLGLTAVLSALHRRARTGIGADVRKDMAMPFKNVMYTQTDKDTHTDMDTHTYTHARAHTHVLRATGTQGARHGVYRQEVGPGREMGIQGKDRGRAVSGRLPAPA